MPGDNVAGCSSTAIENNSTAIENALIINSNRGNQNNAKPGGNNCHPVLHCYNRPSSKQITGRC